MPSDQAKTKRLPKESRDEITRRVLAGEKCCKLAAEFGVSPTCVSQIKLTALDPERFRLKAESKLSLKLTQKQIDQLKQVFETSTPDDNGLIPARDRWTLDHGFQLARKLFNKKPSVRAMKECMKELLARRPFYGDPKPKPPRIPRIEEIDPEFAKDPSYVAYVRSPIYQKIAQREYEMALADWERRNPNGEESPGISGSGGQCL
jgi:hypothetical protein